MKLNTIIKEESQMKKVLSTLVATLVAFSFAGIVCAAQPVPDTASATGPIAPDTQKKAPVKKHKKHKKAVKKIKAAPTTPAKTPTTPKKAPATPKKAPATPAKAPASPAAK